MQIYFYFFYTFAYLILCQIHFCTHLSTCHLAYLLNVYVKLTYSFRIVVRFYYVYFTISTNFPFDLFFGLRPFYYFVYSSFYASVYLHFLFTLSIFDLFDCFCVVPSHVSKQLTTPINNRDRAKSIP